MKYQLLIQLFILISISTLSCKKAQVNDVLPEVKLNVSSPFSMQIGSVVSIRPELSQQSESLAYSWSVNGINHSDQLNFDYEPQQTGVFSISLEIKNQAGQSSTTNLKLVVLKNNTFKVMGYLPSWKNANPSVVKWDALTHLCFAFLKVNADGSLNDTEVSGQLQSIVNEGHKNGVAVLISVGGGGTANFSDCLLNESSRKNLTANLVKFAATYEVDGLDIDYEEFEGSSTGASTQDLIKRMALENLYSDLRKSLPADKLLTAAVSPSWQNPNWGYYNCYTNSMVQYLDFVGLMIYDQSGTWNTSPFAQHSDYQAHFIPSINHWLTNRQAPKNKILAGVPFYGYKFKDTNGGLAEAISYRDILSQYPNNQVELKDSIVLIFYNGKETIQEKANYIKNSNLGGIMIWEITQDDDDTSKSLLTAIKQILGEGN
ncbi:MAG: glycosyl hydrolase family 18 protein [Prolixibacteraceae bacterium]|jgi:chitinase